MKFQIALLQSLLAIAAVSCITALVVVSRENRDHPLDQPNTGYRWQDYGGDETSADLKDRMEKRAAWHWRESKRNEAK